MKINVYKLHHELVAAGIPIEGVAATEPPRIDFLPDATKEQRKLAEEILVAHIPEGYQEKRKIAYIEAGITIDAMVVALWERIVEGHEDTSDALQALRKIVKQQFPSIADEQISKK